MNQELKKQIAKLRKEGKEQEASKLERNSEGYERLDFNDKILGSRETARHVYRFGRIILALIVFFYFLLFIRQFL